MAVLLVQSGTKLYIYAHAPCMCYNAVHCQNDVYTSVKMFHMQLSAIHPHVHPNVIHHCQCMAAHKHTITKVFAHLTFVTMLLIVRASDHCRLSLCTQLIILSIATLARTCID